MVLKENKNAGEIQRKAGEFLSWLPLTPNQVTLSAVLLAFAGFVFSYHGFFIYSFALFALSAIADALDGAIARARNKASARGAYLDGISDRIVEFFLVLSFFFYPLPGFMLPAWLLLIVVLFFGSALTSYAGAYAQHRGLADSEKVKAQPGILPRAERTVLLLLAFFLIPLYPLYSSVLLFAGGVLSVATFIQRVYYYMK